ncbi:MAG: hypothetical protein ABIQ53_15790 [Terracoccus sp.]
MTALTQLPFPTRNEYAQRHPLGVAASRGTPVNRAIPGPEPSPHAVLNPPDSVALDRAERRAVAILAAVGLVDPDTANRARAVLETGRRLASVAAADGQRRAI